MTVAGLSYALHRVHAGEKQLHLDLLRVAEQHPAEHEIRHIARELSRWSADHARALVEHAERHGIDVHNAGELPDPQPRVGRRQHLGERDNGASVHLLEDLCDLHLQAADNSLAWEMLAQYAQAERQKDLLELTQRCHPRNLRQLRWANSMIKTQTPQILTSM